ncbi:MAG: hypothetical protein PHC38_04090 [Weeksellaceae bacterium]|nr:hypothetical protein [Weeksellaceae bacterium]
MVISQKQKESSVIKKLFKSISLIQINSINTIKNKVMRKITFSVLLITLSSISFCQITTTKVVEKIELANNTTYDSTKNFLGLNVNKYLGQELYLKGKTRDLRESGYSGFCIDYRKSIDAYSNTYKAIKPKEERYLKFDLGGGKSIYDSLANKYFTVLDIIKHPKSTEIEVIYGRKYFLKLIDKSTHDTIYYEYDSEAEHLFPFIVVGYYEKLKKEEIGKEFIFTYSTLNGAKDIITGIEIPLTIGQKWKCIDITIEEEYFSLSYVIQNNNGQKTTVPVETFENKSFKEVYSIYEANKYIKKFGNENFNLILRCKLKIGMTKEMCKLSWGEPLKINASITSNKKSEQWVYSNDYLNFENGILTAIQKNK